MTNRERVRAILHYEGYDRMPFVHFSYWQETLEKWCDEGYLSAEEIVGVADGNGKETAISSKLGFDFNWFNVVRDKSDVLSSIYPLFESRILEEMEDGSKKVINEYGVAELIDTVGDLALSATAYLLSSGIDVISLECDGKIDALVPVWVENGVNTIFPIEVGT